MNRATGGTYAAEDSTEEADNDPELSDDEDALNPSAEEEPDWYDKDLDDKDAAWANKQRQGRPTDALLSCPACFTTLCIDCQRHEKYSTQFRAMFVSNCKLKKDGIRKLASTLNEKKSSRRRKREEAFSSEHGACVAGDTENAEGEPFRIVCCEVCGTEVGVFDKDEVYHFHNVLPSY